MDRTELILDAAGPRVSSIAVHAGDEPCGGSMPLFPDVHHSVVSNTRNAVRPAAATRKPRRAPRFVPSNRYVEPQNKPIADSTVRTPMIVGFHKPCGASSANT